MHFKHVVSCILGTIDRYLIFISIGDTNGLLGNRSLSSFITIIVTLIAFRITFLIKAFRHIRHLP
jgi:hypothetical protein